MRDKSVVFWQTGQLLGIFSTGTEKEHNPVFSGIGPETGAGKGARIGLIFPQSSDLMK